MGRGKKYTTAIALAILAVAVLGLLLLRQRAKVADIISDEAAWDFRDSLAEATTMKVAILQDGHVARVSSEDDSTYLCDIQDYFTVNKSDVRVELWSAADGKGIVYLKQSGERPAYSKPDHNSEVVAYLISEEGFVPETYLCLGLSDGWFKVDAGGETAYIEAKYVYWDAIDSF